MRNLIGVHSDDRGPRFFQQSAADNGQLFDPQAGELGNLPRFGFSGPSQFTWDLGVIKRFPVTEAMDIEFRGEFFNLTNTANFNTGVADTQTSSTLLITSGNFGRLTDTNVSARIVQFSLKVIF